jgi:hypothetical protein
MRRQASAFFGGTAFSYGVGLGQAFPAAIEKLEGFCRRKQALADQWAELAEGDAEYGDVARDAQRDADDCFQDLIDQKAAAQRRAVLEPMPRAPLGPVQLRLPPSPIPMEAAPQEASLPRAGPGTETADCPLYAPKDAEGRCLQRGIPTLPGAFPAAQATPYSLGWIRPAFVLRNISG